MHSFFCFLADDKNSGGDFPRRRRHSRSLFSLPLLDIDDEHLFSIYLSGTERDANVMRARVACRRTA